jgi:hypothetical protein
MMSDTEKTKAPLPTFFSLRMATHFDIGSLARDAGVDTMIIRKMLLLEPVNPLLAQVVLATYNRLYGTQWRLQNMAIAVEQLDEQLYQ